MRNKILLSLGTVLAVVASVAAFSAYEAHVINVTAHIENALKVLPITGELNFGTVFPQEHLEKRIWITYSDSFCATDQRRVLNVSYKIVQKPKCINAAGEYAPIGWDTHECPAGYIEMPLLCPYLSKLPVYEDPAPYTDYGVPSFHDPLAPSSIARGIFNKDEDLQDEWIIDLDVPCFEGYCAQDWTHPGWELPYELESKTFGCDLWVEVTSIGDTVALENKDANWDIIPGDGIDGSLIYAPESNSFKGVVMARGLESNKQYQLTINGPGGGDVTPGSTNDLIAGSACDAGNMFRGGWWTGSLPVVCQSGGTAGWEGFYVFDLVAHNDQTALAVTDDDGNLYYEFDVAMRPGSYSGVKFLIKENFSPWQGKMFEVSPISFTVF